LCKFSDWKEGLPRPTLKGSNILAQGETLGKKAPQVCLAEFLEKIVTNAIETQSEVLCFGQIQGLSRNLISELPFGIDEIKFL
jgi:hypothetical protein